MEQWNCYKMHMQNGKLFKTMFLGHFLILVRRVCFGVVFFFQFFFLFRVVQAL